MTTVKTAVRDLKPGDVVPVITELYAVLDVGPALGLGGNTRREVLLARIGPYPAREDRTLREEWVSESSVNVVRPDLTPAQAHADELLALVWRVSSGLAGADEAHALLRKINPPNPPTAEELAAALLRVCLRGAVGNPLLEAEKLVDRARLAGLLPNNGGQS